MNVQNNQVNKNIFHHVIFVVLASFSPTRKIILVQLHEH